MTRGDGVASGGNETVTRGFHFDLNTCTGCHACRLACAVENSLPFGESWRDVHDFNPENDPRLPVFHLSLACNHCNDAPCMSSCPALAYRRDGATGAVLVDGDRCIGCSYCSWACPYDAPVYDETAGVMTKCTLCEPRVAAGRDPACVEYCPTGALTFGGLDAAAPGDTAPPEPDGATPNAQPSRRRDRTVPGFDERDIGPRIRFTPLRDERWRFPLGSPAGNEIEAPVHAGEAKSTAASSTSRASASPTLHGAARRLSLRSEWPLAAFTLLAAASVGIFASGAFAERPVGGFTWLAPAAAGLALSLSHLGRKTRAWRAVLNLRRSWVSREIVAFGLFLALALLSSPDFGGRAEWTWFAVAAGYFALWAMDRVYNAVAAPGSPRAHSAEVFDTGLYLTFLLAGWPALAALVAAYKLVLYLVRKTRIARAGGRPGLVRSAARVVLGMAVPLGLALDRPEAWPVLAFCSALAGEAVDRLEFYAAFRLSSPGAELGAEMERRLAVGHRGGQGV